MEFLAVLIRTVACGLLITLAGMKLMDVASGRTATYWRPRRVGPGIARLALAGTVGAEAAVAMAVGTGSLDSWPAAVAIGVLGAGLTLYGVLSVRAGVGCGCAGAAHGGDGGSRFLVGRNVGFFGVLAAASVCSPGVDGATTSSFAAAGVAPALVLVCVLLWRQGEPVSALGAAGAPHARIARAIRAASPT